MNEALEAVGMSEYRKRSASKLSGGQKQRSQPRVLAMASANSDFGRVHFHARSQRTKRDYGNRQKAQRAGHNRHQHHAQHGRGGACGQNYRFAQGQSRNRRHTKEVFASGLLEACGLTLPPVYALCKSLESKGFVFDSAALTEEELAEGVCRQLK